ncbi:MAG: type II toxin-antitoxin system PemK/MazF family toxin [Candidatus Gracilibacteria bacterium]|nr:type II toxin-antitoxin system PemK/MazF family toxin [Candidatus Gracilibacteria bacterium]MDQ7022143.1 type II toxin-antitoxin system PemK/MazF family toxin [Candidatus Gracilibacteria bacterium]
MSKNIELNIIVNNFLDKSVLICKSFNLFVKETFLLQNKNKSHNLDNHIQNFKDKILINQQNENFRRFQKYNIHYVNFGINIGNEINGIRPGIIIKSNRHNRGYDIVVIPITSLYNEESNKKDLDTFDIILNPNFSNKL